MMDSRRIENSGRHIGATAYKLDLFEGCESARLAPRRSRQLYFFHPSGAVNPVGKIDECLEAGKWNCKETPKGMLFSREEKTICWKKKTACILLGEDFIEMYFIVEGKGAIEDVRFARGCFKGSEFGFAGEFDEVYNTAPNFHEQLFYHPSATFTISFGDDLSPAVGGQALASCCSCIGLRDRTEACHLVAGVAAQPGSYDWDSFVWNPADQIPPTGYIGDQMLAGGFAITYAGKKQVDGVWETPHFVFRFASSREEVLPAYLKHCYKHGYMAVPHRKRTQKWWYEPIYCTWHDQVALSSRDRNNFTDLNCPGAGEFCTESCVEEWLAALIENDCKPGTLILDAKWQMNLNDADPDKEKFPDMRGWIERCHERGIKVFLWTAAWNNDNIPEDEAITRDGKVVCGDITNPKYEARFREMLRRYYSAGPDGLNADGVKMDGLLGLPIGPGLKNCGNLWGLELQKRYLEVLYEGTKAVKPEACVSTFTANPYLADYCDMVRLADMYHSRLTPARSMLHRAEIYRQTCPHSLIDTDGQFRFCASEDYVKIFEMQSRIGIPCLYNGKVLRYSRFFVPAHYRELTQVDYKTISKVMKSYRKAAGLK